MIDTHKLTKGDRVYAVEDGDNSRLPKIVCYTYKCTVEGLGANKHSTAYFVSDEGKEVSLYTHHYNSNWYHDYKTANDYYFGVLTVRLKYHQELADSLKVLHDTAVKENPRFEALLALSV